MRALPGKLLPVQIVASLLFFVGAAWAEETGSRFESFDRAVLDTGLQNSGMAIQDRDGFLWIATNGNGLYRYDGYQVKAFTAARPGSLPDPQVHALYEDRDGIIWIGTAGSGLVSYDKKTDAFTYYRHDPSNPASLGGDSWLLTCKDTIVEDPDGTLWVGNNSGLNALDRRTGAFTRYQHVPGNPGSLSSNFVRAVLVDSSGVLWVATEGGLDRLDRHTGAFRRSLQTVQVNSIEEDRDGLLWLATQGNGLLSLDRNTGAIRSYLHDPENPDSPRGNDIQQVFQDSMGRLWLVYASNARKCVSTFDKKTRTFTHYQFRPEDPNTPSSDIIVRIFEDRGGIIWILNDEGIVDKLDPRKLKFTLYRNRRNDPKSLSANIASSAYEDREGNIWIGAVYGLNKVDKRTRTFTRYREDLFVACFCDDSTGVFWIGTTYPGTLNIFDRKRGRIVKSYSHDASNPASIASSDLLLQILEDRNDPAVLWLALSDGGVDRFDKRTQTFTHYRHDPGNPNSLGGNSVSRILQDRDGSLWVSITGGGLNRLDPRTGNVVRYKHDPANGDSISTDAVYTAFEDSTGRMWVGTAVGFERLDRATGAFTHYGPDKGVPATAVTVIREDEDGRLWMATMGTGLIRFDPRAQSVRVYTAADGLQGSIFYPLTGLRDRDGEMWFGGSKGLTSFFPREIVDNSFVPPVMITALKQGGEEMSLGMSAERVREISLGWRNNYFEFECAALNFTSAERNQYKYKLEGLDKEWYNAGTRRFGRYSGLRGGDYTLRIIGSNNDGVWNTKGVSLKVRVSPPWWESWWFYGLCAAVVAAAGFFIYRSKDNQLKAARAAAIALQESERRYRDVFNSTSDALFIHDEAGRVLDVNDRMCTMYGYAREAALGLSIADVSANAPPYSQPDGVEKIRRAICDGPQVLVWRSRRADGSLFWSEIVLHSCVIAGEKRVIASVRDITERKRAEEMLRQSEAKLSIMVKMGKIGYWEHDVAEDMMTLNDQFYSIFRTSAEKAGGYRMTSARYMELFVLPDDIPLVIAVIKEGGEAEGPPRDRHFEHRIMYGDGTIGYISIRYVVEKDDQGRPVMTRGVVQDIGELKKAEQEIRKLNEELERRVAERTAQLEAANRELEAFAYSVSHDLRAPLRAIDGYTHILLEDHASKLDTDGQRMCRVVRASTARMGRLIDDLLSFSRLSHVAMRSTAIDMKEMVDSILRESIPPADRERIEVRVDTLPRGVGDPSLIRQVWQNLLSNAVKFSSKREKPVIEVGGRQEADGNAYWVRDNGAGFDMEYVQKLFGVFQRLHTEDQFPGTGVGLAIVQRVVARHGGRVLAEGKTDGGATFTFTLPRREE